MRNVLVSVTLVLAVGLFTSCGDDRMTAVNVDDDLLTDLRIGDGHDDGDADAARFDTTEDVDKDQQQHGDDFGTPCNGPHDCDSGYCVQAADGTVCSKTCETTCPDGWSCEQVPNGGLVASICLPNFPTLCMPCMENSECDIGGSTGGARCIPIGEVGSFCAGDCTELDCPSGFTCRDIEDVDGEVAKQCIKDEPNCECSALAISQGAKTECLLVNDFGTCIGQRHCSDAAAATGGLTDCEGHTASADVCDGADNDCSEDTLDGSADPQFGAECDGDDADLCLEGTFDCVDGNLVCSDANEVELELCDTVDNDCDPATADGEAEPEFGTACDGDDEDLCLGGTMGCVDGKMACVDAGDPLLDLCDGADNDCNPDTLDGSQDPQVGTACDGDDVDLCAEGVWTCAAGALVCDEVSDPKVELCDDIDNDCDPATADGTDEPSLGTVCDGDDDDLCEGGYIVCAAGELTCDDSLDSEADVCDGEDNDCNPDTLDGSGDGGVGLFCDGDDVDSCADGTTQCVGGAIECVDPDDQLLDLCDGVDNDCDPATEDGSGDPLVGVACDGDDSDLCQEGKTTCYNGAVVCDDPNTETPELCDGVDNDCDPTTADGSAEPTLGVDCDGDDADMCVEGKQACINGVFGCDDPNDDDSEICDGIDNDCDGAVDEDFPNSDGDALPDCLDDDDDDDGVEDALDCAPTDPSVFPSCDGKLCGDDGCGGSCGSCGGQDACVGGVCVCQPDCNGKNCGGDGCGGSCGSCGADHTCQSGQCTPNCVGSCAGKTCGDNGCGVSCGGCPGGQVCDGSNCYTPCVPNCGGVQCGASNCPGVSCGSCGANETCNGGTCQPICVPNCNGKVCGDNGCGGSCGGCGANFTCSGGQCVPICVPNCNGVECGGDGCGGSCGSCGANQTCSGGQCIQDCIPNCDGKQCGGDGCDADCGVCGPGTSCKGGICKVEEVQCQGNACPTIFNQKGAPVKNAPPGTTLCSILEQAATCVPANGGNMCYEWSYEMCNTCCWKGKCKQPWEPCE